MSTRDRLAASRAERQQTAARAQALEMSDLSPQPLTNGHESGPTSTFLSEVASIQDGIERINVNITNISALHARTLNVIDSGRDLDAAQLDELTAETRKLMNNLKDRIKALDREPMAADAQMRRNRTALVRSKFLEAIQTYQRVEQEYRAKSRQRVERQLKIVKPDATPEEVSAVAEGGGQQIFAQALTSSPRYAESRNAYREVQERQEDLKKMEQTLVELTELFIDMGTLIDQQEETVNNIERTAKDVEADTDQAVKHTRKAVIHARSYRKGRWICFFIFLFVIAVLAIVLGVVFGRH
ncbi:t-SNARE [Tricholoma matsutake]|nr:t-SNARE [Tricholoma matsutake 945]